MPQERSLAQYRLENLFGHNFKLLKIGRPERCGDCHVRGVPPGGHEYSSNSWRVMTRVKAPPTVLKIDFKPSAEIHRRRRDRHADVAEIAGRVTRRNIQTPAQRYGEVLKVAANTYPLIEDF